MTWGAPLGNDNGDDNSGGAPLGNTNAEGNLGGGAPIGNQNAARHGVYSDPELLYEEMPEQEKHRVRERTKAYIEVAPFGLDDPRAERVALTCLLIEQEHRAHAEILQDGLIVKKIIGTDDDGKPITADREHHLSREGHRLNERILSNLKELGLVGAGSDIDRPHQHTEKERNSLAEFLSNAVGGTDDDGQVR